MDHTQFLSTVSPKDRNDLTAKTDGRALGHAALHLSVIVALAAWIIQGLPGWPLLVPVLGVAQAFLFTLQHEATHKTPFRTPWMNEVAGFLTGLILIQPFLWFRAFHMAHHRFTNDPERDPERAAPKPDTIGKLVWHLFGVGYWRAKVAVLFGNALGRFDPSYVAPRQVTRLTWEARIMILAYCVAFLVFGPLLFWIWVLPLALGFPILRFYLLAEHGGCPAVPNMFQNSRTTLTNPLVRWLAWNMPYHAEHHAWPSVPYHKLPDVHRMASEHLGVTSPGYRQFAGEYVAAMPARPGKDRSN